jgi:FdhE protein
MTASTATVRVMSPEEIAARAGGETPFFVWPRRETLFAERAMRLRQLARGHAMEGYLALMAELAQAQQAELSALATAPGLPLPDSAALDTAARRGVPPLAAADWPRDPAWHGVLQRLLDRVLPAAPEAARPLLRQWRDADAEALERQADAVLLGVAAGLDLAAAPFVGAALQVVWTHLLLEVQRTHASGGQPFGRLDDPGLCPCCGSRPTASLTRSSGESLGQRYLHCSLCNLQWHLVRGKCSHCGDSASVAYQSLDTAEPGDDPQQAEDAAASRAAKAVVQAETCDACGSYLKILHSDRDPFVDPVADDLASLTLDLLVSESGKARSGVNAMLLFGPPEGRAAPPGGAP